MRATEVALKPKHSPPPTRWRAKETKPLESTARPFLAQPVPSSLRKSFEKLDAALWIAVSNWMKRHGKVIKAKLSDEQKRQLKMTFNLMDADGGGTIDGGELGNAFQLLGISMPPKEIEAILHEVDRSGTGELEMDDFTQLMVLTLSRRANQAGEHAKGEDTVPKSGHTMQQASLPFEVVALAYRRKKLIEALQTGDKAVLAKFATDDSYSSSPPPADGLLSAPQNGGRAEADPAGGGQLTSPRRSMGRKRQSGSHRVVGPRGKPGWTKAAPSAAALGKPADILSMLKEDNILPASEYRVVLAMVNAGG